MSGTPLPVGLASCALLDLLLDLFENDLEGTALTPVVGVAFRFSGVSECINLPLTIFCFVFLLLESLFDRFSSDTLRAALCLRRIAEPLLLADLFTLIGLRNDSLALF